MLERRQAHHRLDLHKHERYIGVARCARPGRLGVPGAGKCDGGHGSRCCSSFAMCYIERFELQ